MNERIVLKNVARANHKFNYGNMGILGKDSNYNNWNMFESLHIKGNHSTINFKIDTYDINSVYINLIQWSNQSHSKT